MVCCALWRGSILLISTAPRASRSMCSTSLIRLCRKTCGNSAPANVPSWSWRRVRPITSNSRSTLFCAAAGWTRALTASAACPQTATIRRRCCCAVSRASLRRRSRAASMPKPFRAASKTLVRIAQARLRRSTIFRRGRRISAPAVRSARFLPRSNWPSANSGRFTSVASNVFNQGDGVLVIMQNGYASATGQQYLPSSVTHRTGAPAGISIEKTLRSLGVNWLRTVRSYSVGKMAATLKEAMRSAERGLKVIIADGECMLARQRRIRVEQADRLKRGERVVRTRYGVDDELCTGDHSCIRLSGCPSLTVKPNPDPLRQDPVAAVVESCVGCGLCGEVAHAAVLCPSFYRADVVTNPNWWDRTLATMHGRTIAWLSSRASPPPLRGRSAAEGSRERDLKAGELQLTGREESTRAGAGETVRPITILIAALGGEGGGVLTDWIVTAAASQDFPVQSTSIPGVAQRTGATTYHIEMVPVPMASARGSGSARRPILALAPAVGDVDLLIASELMEAGRAVAGGYTAPDHTVAIASTSRSYLVVEKAAMS